MYDEKKIVNTGVDADPDAGPGADMPPEAMQEVAEDG